MVNKIKRNRRRLIKPLEQSVQYLIKDPKIQEYANGIITAAVTVSSTDLHSVVLILEKKKEIS